jgi:hypothetical protein
VPACILNPHPAWAGQDQEFDGTPLSSVTLLRSLGRASLILAACLCAAPALAQRGALTIPRNLDQLTDRAADIVRGTVVSARVEKHPGLSNLDTIVVTLRLTDTLKGSARETFTFRQFIWDMRDRQDAAGYRKGQELLLLMIAPSRYGLSSPAGLEQGRFRIERDRKGREMAVNGVGNFQLFEGMGANSKPAAALSSRQASLVTKHRKGPVDAADLAAMIRALAEND